jgi:hypothetical protein
MGLLLSFSRGMGLEQERLGKRSSVLLTEENFQRVCQRYP